MDFNASLCCHFSFSNVQLMFEDEAEHLIGLTLTQLVGGQSGLFLLLFLFRGKNIFESFNLEKSGKYSLLKN